MTSSGLKEAVEAVERFLLREDVGYLHDHDGAKFSAVRDAAHTALLALRSAAEREKALVLERDALSARVLALEGALGDASYQVRAHHDMSAGRACSCPQCKNDEWGALLKATSPKEADGLSAEERERRKPPSPETLVDALQDRVHTEAGRGRAEREPEMESLRNMVRSLGCPEGKHLGEWLSVTMTSAAEREAVLVEERDLMRRELLEEGEFKRIQAERDELREALAEERARATAAAAGVVCGGCQGYGPPTKNRKGVWCHPDPLIVGREDQPCEVPEIWTRADEIAVQQEALETPNEPEEPQAPKDA